MGMGPSMAECEDKAGDGGVGKHGARGDLRF